MSDILEKKSGLDDYAIKLRHLVFNVVIVGNATPASKTHAVDISDSVQLQSEGKNDISAVDPLTGLSVQTPNDAAGTFNILLSCLNAKTVKRVVVTSAAAAVVTTNISALKNLLLQVNSADDLSTSVTFTYRVELDYLID